MHIGIVVWSATGHTLAVAEELAKVLTKAGHKAAIEKIEINVAPGKKQAGFSLTKKPNTDAYDAVIFGSPVEAFSLSPVMKRFLGEPAALKSKKIFCLVTEQLPLAWMGGNTAIKQMKGLLEANGAIITGTAVINWGGKKRQAQIEQTCLKVVAAF